VFVAFHVVCQVLHRPNMRPNPESRPHAPRGDSR
jgi:hypothetical protein